MPSLSNQNSKLRKYVLTGGTSVGKTTIIDLLSKLGHATLPEFSRVIINRELKKENGILPWNNPEIFQDMYAKEQAKEENEIEKYLEHSKNKERIFMDRCIIDGIAFCQHAKVAVPQEINFHVQRLRESGCDYNLVFILEPLDQYHFDEGRVLKPEESLSIQGLIENSYMDYGYSLVSVPFMSPEERVDFILDKVEGYESGCTFD